MSGQPRFILHNRYDRQMVQAHTMRLTWKVIYKREPLSFGTNLIDEGKRDKTKIDVRPRGKREDGTALIAPTGERREQVNWVEQIERKAADVKQVIREIREEEAVRLDVLDEQIAEAQSHLKALREERAATVREAWTKAHVVRLAEIEAMVTE